MTIKSDQMEIRVGQFEGPLDLLLSLIKEMKMDIHELRVAEVTQQYLAYVQKMKDLSLEIASEYLVMAATLIEIKGRELLPVEEEELDLEDDPKEQLIDQLILYEHYKAALPAFRELEEERSKIHHKQASDLSSFVEKVPLSPNSYELNDLLLALTKMSAKWRKSQPMQRTMAKEQVSIEDCLLDIKDRLPKSGERMALSSVLKDWNRSTLVAYFLAFLQLVREGEVVFSQDELFEEIWLQRKGE
ncbi:segregation/condensation protein A [Atopobacter sp. AH10]|uniref:segregation/condensation protein A n=1 Tax=Atopobacter sp. AH10 TaxID=2315861 RepID=UPI000EF1A8A1|nr:segregation/condensation protein A [Atopobacter sp. AH10]RLK63219.1 segregation/condensation protein A [Atopobacter sp. AH10]